MVCPKLQRSALRSILKEDIGRRDITTEMVIPADLSARAVILAKEDFIVCGLNIAKSVFLAQDRRIRFKAHVTDGQNVEKGKVLAKISGPARSILTAERTALNYLGLLSGITTKTREYVKAVAPYKVKIMDTRKTIPGLRELEKYAVRTGGGYNHRMRLDEMVLVKDNHLKVIGGYLSLSSLRAPVRGEAILGRDCFVALRAPRNDSKESFGTLKLELEVKNLKEFRQALKLKPDIIMLDNMSVRQMKKAVMMHDNLELKLEASGGITLSNIKKIASTGVDMISIGALTHSVRAVDISLEVL